MNQYHWDWTNNHGNKAFDYSEPTQRGKTWTPTSHPSYDSSPTVQEVFPNEFSTPHYHYGYGTGYQNQDHCHAYDTYSSPQYRYGDGTEYPTQDQNYGYDGHSTLEYQHEYGGYSSHEHQYGYDVGYHSWNVEPEHEATQTSQIQHQDETKNMMKHLLQNIEDFTINFNNGINDIIGSLKDKHNDFINNLEMLNYAPTHMEMQDAYTHITEDSDDQEGEDFIQEEVQTAQAEPAENKTLVDEMDQIADELLEELAEEENGAARYLNNKTFSYEKWLDPYVTVDELEGFADLSKSNTELMESIEEDKPWTRHANSTCMSSPAQNQAAPPALHSTKSSSPYVEWCLPKAEDCPELKAPKLDLNNDARKSTMMLYMEEEDSYSYLIDWSQGVYISEITTAEVDWGEGSHHLWEEDGHVNASGRQETDSDISYGDKPECYKEGTRQEDESWCNKIDADEPARNKEEYDHKGDLEEEDFTLEEGQDQVAETFKDPVEEGSIHECTRSITESPNDNTLPTIEELHKPPATERESYGENLMEEHYNLFEEAPKENEEEEKSAEEIVKEFELLLGCTIGEDLVIRYEEEDVHKTIMSHSTNIFEEMEEKENDEGVKNQFPTNSQDRWAKEISQMIQIFNKHPNIISTTSPSYQGPRKTYFEKIRIKKFRSWLYDTLRKIPFEEIRMNTFRGWFYDEYDPGDPSSTLTST